MRVSLVRHTAVVKDVVTVCYGVTDVGLCDTFEEEAALVSLEVAPIARNSDIIFTSPLLRAKRLAHHCGYVTAVEDNRLKEMDFGDWEMKPWSEILTTNDISCFFRSYIDQPTPNGESLTDQKNRVKSFLDDQKRKGYGQILVFCHGGVINCARSIVLGASLEDAFAYLPPYGSITNLEY